jgi:hypothetical protein
MLMVYWRRRITPMPGPAIGAKPRPDGAVRLAASFSLLASSLSVAPARAEDQVFTTHYAMQTNFVRVWIPPAPVDVPVLRFEVVEAAPILLGVRVLSFPPVLVAGEAAIADVQFQVEDSELLDGFVSGHLTVEMDLDIGGQVHTIQKSHQILVQHRPGTSPCVPAVQYEMGHPRPPGVAVPIAVPADQGGPRPVPQRLVLGVAVPNPARGALNIPFALPKVEQVRIVIYDVAGRLVRELADGAYPPGFHRATWDGADASGRPVSSGVYYSSLTAGERTLRRSFVIVR